MKKTLLIMLMLLAAFGVRAQDEGTVTLTTEKEVGAEVQIIAYCSTTNQAFKVDWGDGQVKSYNIDPDGYGYSQRIKETVKGSTIKITGPLVKLQFNDAGLTSAELKNLPTLQTLDLGQNSLAEVSLDANMLALKEIDMADNKLTALTFPAMPALTTLDLSNNEIDSHKLDISALAGNLEILKLNYNKLVTLNLMAFAKLQQFYASYNPDLTTVVFADGNENLTSINMSNCYIMHFYGISLPKLRELQLSNNALLSFDEGTHSYPSLSTLSLSNNHLESIDVTKFPKLYSLYINGNRLSEINVSQNTELAQLNVAKNNIKSLEISNNPSINTLICDSNKITKLDISKQKGMSYLSVSGNKLAYVDLTNAYYLKEFRAADTECSFFYFNYLDSWGPFKYIDVRNNKNMTSASINCMFKTLPICARQYGSTPNLLIAGSNGEHSDPSYPTDGDHNWVVDVEGDATATNDDVDVTVDAENTGETVTVTGQYGGMTSEQTFTFSKYSTDNGTFTVSQWSGAYYQQLADVTDKAKTGVPIHITPTPAEGYVFKSVTVNGKEYNEEWFTINEAATIKVNFVAADKAFSFTTGEGQTLSFAIAADKNNTPVSVDWGNGSKQETTIGTGWKRLDGTAAGTTVTIYGDVTRANLESYGEYGEEFGLWNNKITGVDLSGNTDITELNVYMNPIQSIDVSGLTKLQKLDCSYCELTAIDVTKNTELTDLRCYGNELTTLDVSKNTKLTTLSAKVNKLTEVDLTANAGLTDLDLGNNQLTTINLTGLAKLEKLKLMGNKLAAVDLSKNTKLYDVVLSNNKLTDLDVSNNTQLNYISFNGNDIHVPDLSMLPRLRTIDCGGNGMDACELDDFYNLLPERYTLPDDEDDKSTTLTVLTGTEDRPNDAYNADGAIAAAKGWKLNIAGNASGCDKAFVFIKQTANGSIKLYDASEEEIISGDKTKKNSPIKVVASPAAGYELTALKANGIDVDLNSFEITRWTEVIPTFSIATGIHGTSADGISIQGGNGSATITVGEESVVNVYSIQGATVYSGTTASTLNVKLGKGTYLISVKNAGRTVTKKIMIK